LLLSLKKKKNYQELIVEYSFLKKKTGENSSRLSFSHIWVCILSVYTISL